MPNCLGKPSVQKSCQPLCLLKFFFVFQWSYRARWPRGRRPRLSAITVFMVTCAGHPRSFRCLVANAADLRSLGVTTETGLYLRVVEEAPPMFVEPA